MRDPKNCQKFAITQISRAISSELRHILTIGKKLVKQQYLLHMSPQYGELRPTSAWDVLANLGYPSKFQRVSRLGRITARHSSSGRQPNFAALSTGRHLYSALGIGPHSSLWYHFPFRSWATIATRPLSCLSVCDSGVLGTNGWMDQDESTWHGGRPWPQPHCVKWGPSPQFLANVCCGQTAG